MAEADEDEIINFWKGWKKSAKKDTWFIFYNNAIRATGTGWETFQAALISISDGKGWDAENNCPEREEGIPKLAWPSLGVYQFCPPDRQQIKLLGVGYCDDYKEVGSGMKNRQKKMCFAQLKNTAKNDWFEGLHRTTFKQWSSENAITLDAMNDFYMEGDRL